MLTRTAGDLAGEARSRQSTAVGLGNLSSLMCDELPKGEGLRMWGVLTVCSVCILGNISRTRHNMPYSTGPSGSGQRAWQVALGSLQTPHSCAPSAASPPPTRCGVHT